MESTRHTANDWMNKYHISIIQYLLEGDSTDGFIQMHPCYHFYISIAYIRQLRLTTTLYYTLQLSWDCALNALPLFGAPQLQVNKVIKSTHCELPWLLVLQETAKGKPEVVTKQYWTEQLYLGLPNTNRIFGSKEMELTRTDVKGRLVKEAWAKEWKISSWMSGFHKKASGPTIEYQRHLRQDGFLSLPLGL